MSLIYGICATGGDDVPGGWRESMAARAARWPADRSGASDNAHGFAAIRERSAFPDRPAPRSVPAAANGITVAFDGRIDNSGELQRMLGTGICVQDELVLAAYRAWGHQSVARLVGDFALAIWDHANRRLCLARDPMGVRPLFVAEGGGYIGFASNMDLLLTLPFVDRTPDDLWVCDFLESIKSDATSTPYRGLKSVPPATLLSFGPEGKTEERFWHPPEVSRPLEIGDAEATEEFRRLFTQAVSCRIPAEGAVACELSGGLDSTSVAVTAAPLMAKSGRRLQTFSHVLPEEAPHNLPVRDERAEIEAVLATMPATDQHWLAGQGRSQLACLAETISRHGGLQRRDLNAVSVELPQAMQDRDVRVLFSGFGGDQLVTSNGAGYRDELAQQRRWDELAQAVSGGRMSARYLAWRTAPGRALLHRWNEWRQQAGARQKARLVKTAILSDHALLERRLAHPIRPTSGTIAEREREVICSPHVGHRLQDCAVGAGPFGFDYVYPMLDIRLVEFCLKLPGHLKRTPHVRRRMIREAMAGALPDRVRLRDDKSGTTFPTVFTNHIAELEEYRALYAGHRNDPLVSSFISIDKIVEAHDRACDRGRFEGDITKRQLMRVAELCLWSRWYDTQ